MYFKNSYPKTFVGTKATQASAPGVSAGVDDGFLLDAGIKTLNLNDAAAPFALGVGTYGFFNKNTYLSVNIGSPEVTTAQPLILAGAALLLNDKIGPFHGGYSETNKSKYINPRFINAFYKTTSAAPEQAIIHIGDTNFTSGTSLVLGGVGAGYAVDGTYLNVPVTGGTGVGMTVDVVIVGGIVTSVVENTLGTGYLVGDVLTLDPAGPQGAGVPDETFTVSAVGVCEFEFLCDETYNLWINLSGSPVLRVLNHDSYRTLAAYTGCCPDDCISPVPVDSTLVMINWAKQIIDSPYLKDFIRPIVYTEAGAPLFATAAEAVAAGYAATDLWDNYVSTGHTPGALAGLRLAGAYVDTVFGNCTFQVSDFFQKEVVQIQAQLVDEQGNPCMFNGLCVENECCGFGGEGFGETYLRELLLTESYLQNTMHTDLRIREITQGTDYFGAGSIQRNELYTKYVILHSVPRPSNHTSQTDADQYALSIIIPAAAGDATAFEAFMAAWLTAAGNHVTLESYGHVACVPLAI